MKPLRLPMLTFQLEACLTLDSANGTIDFFVSRPCQSVASDNSILAII